MAIEKENILNIMKNGNGNIYNKCNYKNDKIEGEYIKYYGKGNIFYKCYYKNEKKEREYISYYDNSNIIYKMAKKLKYKG